ncbi:uncharacterized protein LOC127797830 isoform X2 [Diospyros lotus]|uniref:uncharacterized protein LOC127797830 isoform X2 n=1 Tax=Diospyros lotus TaxID=55363 RepID=UPI00225A71D0|nr:uncharacterized protein LOC127797830 isoform X2 [Diospyros lotus]
MEVPNPAILTRPRSFFSSSIFCPKKKLYKFKIPNSRLPICPPLSTRLAFSATRNLRVSASSGRSTNRRNSLREKLAEKQQVRIDSIVFEPSSGNERCSFNSDNGSLRESEFNYNAGESKSNSLGESVLWNKLENWVDQYKQDSEFWGIGFGPIFTVFQDSRGIVERVVVNEDEILRRSGIDSSLYKQNELVDFTEVNSKISHAKFLAREFESGNFVLPKNSSVAKFVVSDRQQGFVNAIRAFTLGPSLSRKLSRLGIMVLFGCFVLWAIKAALSGGKDKEEYTRLEKEIMRRKIKARKEKEKLVKGSVEVVQDSVEPHMVSAERPTLNKQDLVDSIMKAKASSNKPAAHGSSNIHASESKEFDSKIQEIRAMARAAREIERGDVSPGDSDGGDDLNVSKLSNRQEVDKWHREGDPGDMDLLNNQSNEYLGQTGGLNGASMPLSLPDMKSNDNGSNEEALSDTGNRQASVTSITKTSRDHETASTDMMNIENEVKVMDIAEVSQLPSTSKSQSSKLKKRFRAKPRVISSVKEAREFLSQKCDKLEPKQELQDRNALEDAAISSLDSGKETDDTAKQILDKDTEVSDHTALDGRSDFNPDINDHYVSVMKRRETLPTERIDPEVADEGPKENGLWIPRALGHEENFNSLETGSSSFSLPSEREIDNGTGQVLDKENNGFQYAILGGPLDSVSAASACGDSNPKVRDSDPEDVGGNDKVDNLQNPPISLIHESNSRSTEMVPSVSRENWVAKNFHELEPLVKKIGGGFRYNYMEAREKVKQELYLNSDIIQPKSDENDDEFDWMKDDRLREIVFQVRENELAGKDPFYQMDDEAKLKFFQGLERKVEKENQNQLNLHKWIHSNIENLDYGADGISLYDPLEKIIPRWKGPPIDKNPKSPDSFLERNKSFSRNSSNSYIEREDGQGSCQKAKEFFSNKNTLSTSEVSNKNIKLLNGVSKSHKTVIESSNGSVRAGKKSGKEYWEHTKKWSQGFLESYNAESDPEIRAVMKDVGKDLDRWITEKEIQEASDLMNKIPERGRQFVEKKLNKVRREMELFGPQAVVSKYREYAEEKEDHLWWLDLPFVLCIELYTYESEEPNIGFYSLEMAADLELDPKQYHVIAFEDPGDCKNLCYIIQSHMEMLGNGNAFVVARPPKEKIKAETEKA